jgi:hypothetical protein
MQLHGIQDLISFLNYLKGRKIHFRLDSLREDAVMVRFTLVGARIEIEFFDDHIEFSSFLGDESVHDDLDVLLGLIRDHWDE